MIREIFQRIMFWNNADRMGPDMLSTHWNLYLKSRMLYVCKKKFKKFDDTAEFRPGAYAIGCSKISIGHRVVVRPLTILHADSRPHGAGITIEDDVLLGPGIQIYVDTHAYGDPLLPIIDQGFLDSKQVVLEKGAWIGAHSVILPGVTVGENSVVGAGSIVTRNIPARVVAAGNPATVLRAVTAPRRKVNP